MIGDKTVFENCVLLQINTMSGNAPLSLKPASDEERFARYEAASKARRADMVRMAANTARIVANRAAAEAATHDDGHVDG